MFDLKHRRPYWLETRRLMIFAVASCLAFVLVVLAFMGGLEEIVFIGFPFGYFLLAHGFIILGFIVLVWHGSEQNKIDRRHGAHEDI